MLNKDEDDDLEGGVIYSNNISEVDSDYYNNFTEQKADNNENYDINKSSQNKKIQLELTSMSNSETNSSEFNDIMQEEKLDDDENNINTPIIEKEKEVKSDSENKEDILLFGNDINNTYPKYLGKMLSFIYIKNHPLIAIGPDCKYFIYI
jgi:hypothetical protein